ncbi:MAG: LapA family protein [Deltaproteobacteria bacterium]|nr:LapA family protein [Deltaproteobacteria bacterium]
MKYKLIISLVLICLIVIFIIQNVAVVEINLFFWTIAMSLVLLMLVLLAIGIIFGWLLKSYSMYRKDNPEQKP